MNIVYMGTPDFAVPALTSLYEAGHHILAVVSQPDKPTGRHGVLTAPPVKEKALALSLPVLQPAKASDPVFVETIRSLCPDVIVVAAYGKILKPALLEIPRCGCVNIHASLLPRWRGAAPIQWAVIAGDERAGLTTMQMDEGLDTGDILLQESFPLAPDETGGSLFDKLSEASGALILKTLEEIKAGTVRPQKQPPDGMTYAPMLSRETGDIDWSKSASEIERLVRGLSPWPGTFSMLGGKILKIHRAAVADPPADGEAGRILASAAGIGCLVRMNDRLFVRCGEGCLELLEVQLEGKKRMKTSDFLRGSAKLIEDFPRLCKKC